MASGTEVTSVVRRFCSARASSYSACWSASSAAVTMRTTSSTGTGTFPPATLPGRGQVADAEGAREVLAQLMAGAHLERLAVPHHRLERVGRRGAGEALPHGLAAHYDRDGQDVDQHVLVDVVQNPAGVGAGI